MTIPSHRCTAYTQSGTRCRNFAVVGSNYCRLHAGQAHIANGVAPGANGTQAASAGQRSNGARPAQSALSPEMEMLAQELAGLIHELNAYRPALRPENLTPAQFAHLFNQLIGRRLPPTPAALLEDVERNLKGTSFADFADPEVLRGAALLTYYSLQAQAEPYKEPVMGRLRRLPGYSLFCDLRSSLAGAKLEDLADIDTYKGVWSVASYAALSRLRELLQEASEADST